ncbi:MAG TPA: hypothetical protein VF297_12540 [Pyrinomonadaceae bacterium]
MKVNRPASPLSSGAEPLEPLDPQELQQAVKGERFAAALSNLEAQTAGGASNPVRAGLEQIARGSTLTEGEGAASAVRESARFMIRSRLHEKFRQSEQGQKLVEKMSEYVAADPLLNAKLLSILRKLKEN